ncbi:MAG: hypothetical protein KBG50_08845, partial [Ruthenibacterium sp.]|nr:hypothetical protein [Ruthenibacterium sp.]
QGRERAAILNKKIDRPAHDFRRMPEPSRIHSVMTESCIRFTLNAVLSTDEAKSSMNLDCGGRLLPVSP